MSCAKTRCLFGCDSDGPNETCIRWDAHWRHLGDTTESSVRGFDAALCQITLTTCFTYVTLVTPYGIDIDFLMLVLFFFQQYRDTAAWRLHGRQKEPKLDSGCRLDCIHVVYCINGTTGIDDTTAVPLVKVHGTANLLATCRAIVGDHSVAVVSGVFSSREMIVN